MSPWNYLLAILASLSAEPAAIDQERPRAAAAVAFAAGQFAPGEPAPAQEVGECENGECHPPKAVLKQ